MQRRYQEVRVVGHQHVLGDRARMLDGGLAQFLPIMQVIGFIPKSGPQIA
ncbi:hypothetical protein TI01_2483 [Lysobacter sp. A03]|nr:hypothetical protein TI01_2483 [Lysobacter sp. A03]